MWTTWFVVVYAAAAYGANILATAPATSGWFAQRWVYMLHTAVQLAVAIWMWCVLPASTHAFQAASLAFVTSIMLWIAKTMHYFLKKIKTRPPPALGTGCKDIGGTAEDVALLAAPQQRVVDNAKRPPIGTGSAPMPPHPRDVVMPVPGGSRYMRTLAKDATHTPIVLAAGMELEATDVMLQMLGYAWAIAWGVLTMMQASIYPPDAAAWIVCTVLAVNVAANFLRIPLNLLLDVVDVRVGPSGLGTREFATVFYIVAWTVMSYTLIVPAVATRSLSDADDWWAYAVTSGLLPVALALMRAFHSMSVQVALGYWWEARVACDSAWWAWFMGRQLFGQAAPALPTIVVNDSVVLLWAVAALVTTALLVSDLLWSWDDKQSRCSPGAFWRMYTRGQELPARAVAAVGA